MATYSVVLRRCSDRARASLYLTAVLFFSCNTLQAEDDIMLFANLVFSPANITPEPSVVSVNGLTRNVDNESNDFQTHSAIASYEKELLKIENEQGPYGEDLEQGLVSLAQLYQSLDVHDKALELLQRAVQISKVNKGLFNTDQIVLVETMITSLLVLEQYSVVDEELDYLIVLHQKNSGENSAELVTALTTKAAWNLQALEERLNSESNSFNVSPRVSTGSLDRQRKALENILPTQRLLYQALEKVVANPELPDQMLIDVEQQLIKTYFWHAYGDAILSKGAQFLSSVYRQSSSLFFHEKNTADQRDYQLGEKAYGRLLAYMEVNPAIPAELYAQTLVSLGDWHMLFGERQSGVLAYEKAENILNSNTLDDNLEAPLFNTALPVRLPAFTLAQSKQDTMAEMEYKGYVDVAFNLNQFGQATQIETLDSSTTTSTSIETELLSVLKNSVFRPGTSAGEPPEAKRVALRYYYTY